MFDRILMVCVGNICRSPMAEALLAHELGADGTKVVVQSAGISALVGHAADPIAQELMKERGLDLSGHRARQLTPTLIRDFELILVMEAGHQRAVEAMHPSARGKVHRLGRWGNFEIPDPYRRPREEFERSLGLIERGVGDLLKMMGRNG